MLRCKSWKVPMNYIGVVVFGISRLEIVLFHVTRAILAANPSLFQLLCIEKLARASRMVTMKSGMTSLHLLIRCLGASTNIFLTLVFCWIACFQCVSDMVASTFCRDFINKESQSLQVCVIEASAEIEAAEVEHFEALGIQASRAWSTCMEQLFARQQVSDAEAAVREEVRKVKCRLEKMRELAKAAAAGAEGAAERKVEASRICRTEASVERTLECSTHCAELAAPAERAVAQQPKKAAEEGAMAEKEKERKLIQNEIHRAQRRTIEVESAINETVSYSYRERSTRELNCMEKVEQIESPPSQITNLPTTMVPGDPTRIYSETKNILN
ncbi:Catsper1 [Symbiodinium sp. CCMP2592]|nr:Catsper1 [Symbiodinium sp. CCMP2592]